GRSRTSHSDRGRRNRSLELTLQLMPRRSTPASLVRVRGVCLSFAETGERLSHGAPTFFVRDKKSFVTYVDDHHGDGRLSLWRACPPGMREGLVKANPEAYLCRRTSAIWDGSACASIAGSAGTRLSGTSEMRTSRWPQRIFHPASYLGDQVISKLVRAGVVQRQRRLP